MEQIVRDFLNVVRNGQCENTYKLAWGRAIVELCVENPERKVIPLTDIAKKVFKYYWNQTIFFGMQKGSLEQSQNPAKESEIVQYVKERICAYQDSTGILKPDLYEKISAKVDFDPVQIVRTLKKDVSHRFQNLSGEDIWVYGYKKGDDEIIVNDPEALYNYNDVLNEAINYRWAQELERFNRSTPNICKKVRLLDRGEIRRGNLKKFDRYLDIENPDHICFRCNGQIDNKSLSRDHVLPWSFLFSDDLWNIVYVHKGCNSEKSNRIPTKSDIDRLLKRNQVMLESKQLGGKVRLEMLYAREHHVLESLWIASGGVE